jgi:cbb3-type cytochrome oxidase subunit 1
MRHFADVQIRRAKHIRVAIWIATAALIVLALALLLRR